MLDEMSGERGREKKATVRELPGQPHFWKHENSAWELQWLYQQPSEEQDRVRDGNNADPIVTLKRGPRQVREDAGRRTWPWQRQ